MEVSKQYSSAPALAVVALLGLLALTPAVSQADILANYYNQALLAVEQNEPNRAILLLDMAIAIEPDNQPARYLRGSLYLQLKQPKPALVDLEVSRRYTEDKQQVDEKIALAWLLIGHRAFHRGDYPEALAALQKARAAAPPGLQPVARYWLAQTQAGLGDDTAAIETLGASLQQYPGHPLNRELGLVLNRLEDQRKPRDWRLQLQFDLAFDDSVGSYPDPYISPLWPDDQDQRLQTGLDSTWSFRHANGSATELGYHLFSAHYKNYKDYDFFSHSLSVDHHLPTANGQWGVNYQVITTDLGLVGLQNDQLLTWYHTQSPNPRRMHLQKVTLLTNDFSNPMNKMYNGTGLSGLYRYHFLKSGRNDSAYIGAQFRYYDAADMQFTYSAVALDAGIQRSWRRLDYGFLFSAESRDYFNRLGLNFDNNQTIRLYSGLTLTRSLSVELGLKHHEGDSAFFFSRYGHDIGYLMARWQP